MIGPPRAGFFVPQVTQYQATLHFTVTCNLAGCWVCIGLGFVWHESDAIYSMDWASGKLTPCCCAGLGAWNGGWNMEYGYAGAKRRYGCTGGGEALINAASWAGAMK